MKLLANGCSFTYGSDMLKSTSQTWPTQLENNFSEVHNIAMGGGSNDRIVRTTLDFCNNNDMNDYMAVIQWTSPFRKEYYNPNTNDWVGGTTLLQDNSSLNNIIMDVTVEKGAKVTDKDLQVISKAATQDMLYLQSMTDYRLSMLKNILTLQNFFKQHNIKYLFTSMGPETHIAGTMFTHIHSLQNSQILHLLEGCVDDTKWTDISFANMLDNNLEYIISQDDTHPNEKGHKLLAHTIWQHIGKIYG